VRYTCPPRRPRRPRRRKRSGSGRRRSGSGRRRRRLRYAHTLAGVACLPAPVAPLNISWQAQMFLRQIPVKRSTGRNGRRRCMLARTPLPPPHIPSGASELGRDENDCVRVLSCVLIGGRTRGRGGARAAGGAGSILRRVGGQGGGAPTEGSAAAQGGHPCLPACRGRTRTAPPPPQPHTLRYGCGGI
jgi:hypothetical protein